MIMDLDEAVLEIKTAINQSEQFNDYVNDAEEIIKYMKKNWRKGITLEELEFLFPKESVKRVLMALKTKDYIVMPF
ncbi:MAG: hypothetical protein ACP5IV_07415 [Caldisericia bacterium]